MQLQREAKELNSITHYDHQSVIIQDKCYRSNLIVSNNSIQTWSVVNLAELNTQTIEPLLYLKPQVIILGRSETSYPSPEIIYQLAQNKIGLECMPISAACRTFNLLLSEGRAVVLALIF